LPIHQESPVRKSRTDAELKAVLADLRGPLSDIDVIEYMRELLTEYMTEFPAFRAKPLGSPGSDGRKEQEADIAREDRARAVLALRPGFARNTSSVPK
jgi:hypothetical protein